jgi:oligopeptidase B
MARSMTDNHIPAPIAKKISHEMNLHNHTRIDPYFWLNQREDEEVLSYLREENEYLENVMAPLKPLRESLFTEMKSRIKEDDESVPYKEGNCFTL